jgi:LPXTG-motif cell wall-anchored protein
MTGSGGSSAQRIRARALAVVAVIMAAGAVTIGRADAATFTVTNANDAGPGSLRAAIASAAGSSGDDQITVNSGVGTITLSSPITFAANGALSIVGQGVTIDAGGNDGALVETGGTGALSIDGLTITDASGFSTDAGALVVRGAGNLTLSNCSISGNTATPAPFANAHGAAVVMLGSGSTSVTNCKFTDNAVSGAGGASVSGGLDVEGGPLTVTNSEIAGNSAQDLGNGFVAGAVNATRAATIVATSMSKNAVTGDAGDRAGGAILSRGTLSLTNSTVTENSVDGAVASAAGGVTSTSGLTLVYATIASNTASVSAANLNVTGTFTSFGTVVAPAASGLANCRISGTTTSHYNFSDDASCHFSDATDKQNAGSPNLGPLAANGGAGQTRIPQAGSPLIDAIPADQCTADGAAGVTSDEIGTTRPQGTACDIGAIEVKQATPATTSTTTAVTSPSPTSPTTAAPALPRTGASTTGSLVVAAGVMLACGLLLVARTRRRRA